MKNQLAKAISVVTDMPARLHIAIHVNPERSRAIGFGLIATSVVGPMLAPGVAEAAGLSTWMNSIKTTASDAVSTGVFLAYAVGLGLVGVGVNKGIAKSKGDQQVTTGSIFGYGLGGAMLMGLTAFADAMMGSASGGTAAKPAGVRP